MRGILDAAYTKAAEILTRRRTDLEMGAAALLATETATEDELKAAVGESE